jgi:hypothetical protein
VAAPPHSLQKFADGRSGAPQPAQCRARGVPHAWQNLAWAGWSDEPQLEQRI